MQVIFRTRQNLVELEASLAPAEADVRAEAKADQKVLLFLFLRLKLSEMGFNCCSTASILTQRQSTLFFP